VRTVFDRRGLFWISRLRRDAARIRRYNVHSRVLSGEGYYIGICLSRRWDNESLYFRRYISVMYNPSWYGNQRFPTCTYDAAVFSSHLLPDYPIPRRSSYLSLSRPAYIPTSRRWGKICAVSFYWRDGRRVVIVTILSINSRVNDCIGDGREWKL